MNIKSAKFVRGIIGTQDILYDGKFQVAFLGRSNVGKSTLINSLTGKPKLARSSSHPGKTIRMDFFLINDAFYFVDFPGYGFARRSMTDREKLAKMILWYLMYSEVKNRLVVLIIDAKVGVTAFDADMIRTLREYRIDYIIVANKVDNLSRNIKDEYLLQIRSEYKDAQVLPHSSEKKWGREELLEKISSYIHE